MLPKLTLRTRLVLLIHRAEARKSTNTGLLAARCVEGAAVHVRGEQDAEPTQRIEVPAPLLLYPAPDAAPLETLPPSADPVTLIVPDGNWRQAAKMRKRVSGLDAIPCVRVAAPLAHTYRLRRESNEQHMATLEAIAHALAVLEGDPSVRDALLRPLHAMIDRTLWSRGLLPAHRVRGGLPEGVKPHDPRGAAERLS